MSEYYCRNCAMDEGLYEPSEFDTLLGTQYQLDKFTKHTMQNSVARFKTVWADPSTASYADYVVTTVNSGGVEVDDRGRVNVFWVASEDTGIAIQGGEVVGPTNGVKLVLWNDEDKAHAYPTDTRSFAVSGCKLCGKDIPH